MLFGSNTYALAQNGSGGSQQGFTAGDLIAIGYVVVGFVYIIPTITAFWRKHPNRWPILLINIIFGGTGLGWFGALIWAMSAVHKSPEGSDGGESGLNLFVNDPQVIQVEGVSGVSQQDAAQAETKPDEANERLLQLKRLWEAGSLTEEEYAALRQPIIDKLMT